MPEPIKVISQQPPGGRCTLYALYAGEIKDTHGSPHTPIYTTTTFKNGAF